MRQVRITTYDVVFSQKNSKLIHAQFISNRCSISVSSDLEDLDFDDDDDDDDDDSLGGHRPRQNTDSK